MSEDYFTGDKPECKHKQEQPWWNDGDKVAGLATTMVMLTAVIILCILAIKLALWAVGW